MHGCKHSWPQMHMETEAREVYFQMTTACVSESGYFFKKKGITIRNVLFYVVNLVYISIP